MCVQDQYGNQYNFWIDTAHNYLYGTATIQGCSATVWDLTGSYYAGFGPPFELTMANPLGTGDPVCVSTAKLKGAYPNGEWYYTTGYGAQPFAFVTCGTAPAADASPKAGSGALK